MDCSFKEKRQVEFNTTSDTILLSFWSNCARFPLYFFEYLSSMDAAGYVAGFMSLLNTPIFCAVCNI